MGDVTCATCGEPWDVYHLRNDEIFETDAGKEIVDWELDNEDLEKHYGSSKNLIPFPNHLERWEGKLTTFWRQQFAQLGWKFGGSIYAVLTCPCCKHKDPLPEASERAEARKLIADLLDGDEDGIATSIEDLGY